MHPCRSSVLGPQGASEALGQGPSQAAGHPAAAATHHHHPGLALSPAMAAVALVSSSEGQNDVHGGSPTTGEAAQQSMFAYHRSRRKGQPLCSTHFMMLCAFRRLSLTKVTP